MQIRVLQSFKHGYDTYHVGDVRTVSDEDAAYFKAHGWVEGGAAVTEQAPVTLDVQSVTTSVGVQNG